MNLNPYRIGDRILRKFIISEIKFGGMGLVYIVRDDASKAQYALKSFHLQFINNAEIRRLFLEEARIWANLDENEHIVTAHAVLEEFGIPYLLLEFVDDKNLRKSLPYYLSSSLDQKLELLIQICSGMAFLQHKGIVHRDLKPENILLKKPNIKSFQFNYLVKITDFGLAKPFQNRLPQLSRQNYTKDEFVESVVKTKGWRGTLLYCSPEQLVGAKAVTTASDIYSFGVLTYELFTGRPPFSSNNPNELCNLHLKRLPGKLRKIAPEIPPSLEAITLKCLEKRPENRFESFSVLKDNIVHVLEEIAGAKVITGDIIKSIFGISDEKIEREIRAGKEKDPRYWAKKAMSYRSLGLYDKALECCDKGIKLRGGKEDRIALNYTKAASLAGLGRIQAALEQYDKLLETNPMFVFGWYDKGNLLARIGEHNDAIGCFTKAITLNPGVVDPYINRASSLMFLCKYKEAVKDYQKVVSLKGDDAHMWYNYGAALELSGNPREAFDAYNKAVSFDNKIDDAWFGMGGILLKQGDATRAEKYLLKACNLKPFESRYQASLAKCRQLLGKRAGESDPLGGNLRTTLSPAERLTGFLRGLLGYNKAVELYNHGLYEEAERQLRTILSFDDFATDKAAIRAWFCHAECLKKLNRLEEAHNSLLKAKSLQKGLSQK